MARAGIDRARLPAGIPAAAADFDDPASIAAPPGGAERAHLATPSSERAEEQQRRFADLAVKAGVRHLVVLSQLAAGEDSPVAAVAAITLTEPGHEGATHTLTGPAPVTHAQIAAAPTDPLGREVTFTDVPPEAFADSLRGILRPGR